MAICQPCVAALAAVALMSEDADPATPRTPDADGRPDRLPHRAHRASTTWPPTKPIAWFEQHLISTVPLRYPRRAAARLPGLPAAHGLHEHEPRAPRRGVHADCTDDLVDGEHEKAEATRRFYDEYFAVADLPAEFYLETVRQVFQEYALARGELSWRGRPVDPTAIRRTALLTVEGERDDICSLGQTLAAHDLCARLPPTLRTHYVQAGVGHYGVFSGRRWESQIYPMVRDVVYRWRG